MSIMLWVISLAFWIIGIFLTSFTLIPALIILRFGIPFTKTLEAEGKLKLEHGITKKYTRSLIILFLVFVLVASLIHAYFPTYQFWFLFGSGIALLTGFGKTGYNDNNHRDYWDSNKDLMVRSNNLPSVEEVIKTYKDTGGN